MSKYKVHVCRTAYSHLDIEVEANSKEEANDKALEDAGNHCFPLENASDYSVEGCYKL